MDLREEKELNLHSSMVRLEIKEELIADNDIEAFTFQYG